MRSSRSGNSLIRFCCCSRSKAAVDLLLASRLLSMRRSLPVLRLHCAEVIHETLDENTVGISRSRYPGTCVDSFFRECKHVPPHHRNATHKRAWPQCEIRRPEPVHFLCQPDRQRPQCRRRSQFWRRSVSHGEGGPYRCLTAATDFLAQGES